MNVGMLWLEREAVSLTDMVRAAAAYYKNKYGKAPTVCYVNSGALAQLHITETVIDGITVHAKPWILPKHLLIGMEGASDGKKS